MGKKSHQQWSSRRSAILHVLLFAAAAAAEHEYLYDCPDKAPQKARNDDVPEYFDYHHDNSIATHLQGEKEQGADEYYTVGFRNSLHGGHHIDYSTYKNMARDFRAEIFGNELKDGDVIYEGAGAEGMNLLMTLEILHEERGIKNLIAYGSDYLNEFVSLANKLWDVQSRANGDWLKRGRYCQGDSTNLHFVPSDTFDLAYTYVDVLIDGQGIFDDDVGDDERCDRMKDLCDSDDPNDIAIIDKDQLMQEEWHAEWVSEMIRIVKPGKLVVIENVCLPLCLGETPWGGVDLDWWSRAAVEYDWEVDIESIQLFQSWFGDAYTVAIRKKKGDGPDRVDEQEDAGAKVAQESDLSKLHELKPGDDLAVASRNNDNDENEDHSGDESEENEEDDEEYVEPERSFSKLMMKVRTHPDREL